MSSCVADLGQSTDCKKCLPSDKPWIIRGLCCGWYQWCIRSIAHGHASWMTFVEESPVIAVVRKQLTNIVPGKWKISSNQQMYMFPWLPCHVRCWPGLCGLWSITQWYSNRWWHCNPTPLRQRAFCKTTSIPAPSSIPALWSYQTRHHYRTCHYKWTPVSSIHLELIHVDHIMLTAHLLVVVMCGTWIVKIACSVKKKTAVSSWLLQIQGQSHMHLVGMKSTISMAAETYWIPSLAVVPMIAVSISMYCWCSAKTASFAFCAASSIPCYLRST